MPTALITGTTSGIGHELAKQFAQNGYDLICIARNKEKLMADAEMLMRDYKINVEFAVVDLTKLSAADNTIYAVNEFGRQIDVLVNNAGVGLWGEFASTKIEDELEMINLNMVTPTILTKHYLKKMTTRGEGKILNVASAAAYSPGPMMSVYHATKAYLLSLSEAIAEELRGSKITVTTLCPGPTTTQFDTRAGAKGLFGFNAGSLLMQPTEVARHGYNGLMTGKRVVYPGWKNFLFRQSARILPRSWFAAIFKSFYAKA